MWINYLYFNVVTRLWNNWRCCLWLFVMSKRLLHYCSHTRACCFHAIVASAYIIDCNWSTPIILASQLIASIRLCLFFRLCCNLRRPLERTISVCVDCLVRHCRYRHPVCSLNGVGCCMSIEPRSRQPACWVVVAPPRFNPAWWYAWLIHPAPAPPTPILPVRGTLEELWVSPKSARCPNLFPLPRTRLALRLVLAISRFVPDLALRTVGAGAGFMKQFTPY